MTFKELCYKWDDSDSISEKEELAEKIVELGKPFYDKILGLHEKYKQVESLGIGDYRSGRGSVKLYSVSVVSAKFKYSDWCRGCEYGDYITVYFADIDNPDYLSLLEVALKAKRISSLKYTIECRKEDIKRYEKEIEELEK